MNNGLFGRWLRRCLFLACAGCLVYPGVIAGGERVYDAADLVRVARMLAGDIPHDPGDADMDGDGLVTEADLDLMLRRVHGKDLPVLLDRQAIGPAGGTLGSGETLTLTVPSGAFDASVTLTLDRLPTSDAPLPDIEHGPLYRIDGIPANAATSLTLRIALPEGMALEGSQIEIGERTRGTSGFGLYHHTVEAVPEAGALQWQVPSLPDPPDWGMAPAAVDGDDGLPMRSPLAYNIASANRTNYVFTFRVVRYARLSGDRFDLYFAARNSFNKTPLWGIVDALEDAYTMLTAAPASFDLSGGSWPVRVYMKDLGPMDGEMVSSFFGDYIKLHNNLLNDAAEARVTAGHEFFHIVQGMFHARTDTLWLDEATATWFERPMDGDPAYVPTAFRNLPRAAMRGMHVAPYIQGSLAWWPGNWFEWKVEEAQGRGYTLSSFFEHISRHADWNLGRLRTLYEHVRNGTHPVEAVAAIVPGGDLKQTWIDFSQALLRNQTYALADNELLESLSYDIESAFNGNEGAWGISAQPRIDNLEAFGTLQEYKMHVQQLGGRSVRKMFRMLDMDQGMAVLPDPIRLIGEAECEQLNDLQHLRLAAVLFQGKDPPQILPLDRNDWIMARATRRIEVSIPRPADGFTYMLAVFNDNVNAPYDGLAPITLRSFIGAYSHPEFTATFHPPFGSTHAAIECLVRDVLLEGDLGTVRASDTRWGADLMRGSRHLAVILPHDDAGPLRLKIDGLLQAPLDRVIEEGNERWTVTVTDDLGWRLYTHVSGEDSVLGPVVPKTDAWTTGFELPVPAADGFISYSVCYYVNVSVLVEDTSDFMPRLPYTFTTDGWYVAPLAVNIQGRNFTWGGQQ